MADFQMYLEESYDNKASFVCLAAVIVQNDKWKIINNAISDLKIAYFQTPDFNLKSLRRRNYGLNGSSVKITKKATNEFEEEYFSILDKNNPKLIAVLIDKRKMRYNDKKTVFAQAYSFLIQRFEYFLDERHCYGSVIMDEAKTSPEITNLRKVHRNILKEGVVVDHLAEGQPFEASSQVNPFHRFTKDASGSVLREIERVVENLQYQQDQDNNFIQMADLVAYAFYVKYNRGKYKYYKKYKKYLRKCPDGKIEGCGIKIFPES